MPSKKTNRVLLAWTRGITLLITLWLAHMFTAAPWAVLGWILPEDLVTKNYVVMGLLLALLLAFGPILFYGCCRFVGITLEDWIKEDEPLADENQTQ